MYTRKIYVDKNKQESFPAYFLLEIYRILTKSQHFFRTLRVDIVYERGRGHD
ncbi:hypothetical protein EMIT079MI2_10319 [Bacillus sp. IT-79MI2]